MEKLGYRSRSWATDREVATMPAEPLQLCLYLDYLCTSSGSKAAIEEATYASGWAHGVAGLRRTSNHAGVKAIAEGARRMLARPIVKKGPITSQQLRSWWESQRQLVRMENRGNMSAFACGLPCQSALPNLQQ